jgi:aromatic-L-amino-acid/L-tryptophan decarboxylase
VSDSDSMDRRSLGSTIRARSDERPLPPLRLTPAAMRTLGYRAVDAIVDRLVGLAEQPVARPWRPAELADRLREPVPMAPTDPADVLDRVITQVFGACAATDHPRFFSYVPGPSNYVGAIADFLAAGFNVFSGHWLVGAGAAEVEMTVLDWLRDLVGLPAEAGGIFASGGTEASLIAVHAARKHRCGAPDPRSLVYISDQTHASITRGLAYLGWAPAQVRTLATGAGGVFDPDLLERRIVADRRAGCRPLLVVATAGSTSTGAVDPLEALGEVCQRQTTWLHVDAAYGGAAMLVPEGRRLLQGIERADSIAIDPHKWWFQPYGAGCVLVRDAALLRDAYTLHSEVLTETRAGEPVNFYDYGPELTRSFRALKLWMSLQVFGLDAFSAAVQHGIRLADVAERLIDAHDDWQVVTRAQLGIVTFRPRLPRRSEAEVDDVTRRIATASLDRGHALVLTTEVGGRAVLRLCTTHPETTPADLSGTLDHLTGLLADGRRLSGL